MARGDTPGEADDPLAINPAAIPDGMSSLESAGGIGETAAESEMGHSASPKRAKSAFVRVASIFLAGPRGF